MIRVLLADDQALVRGAMAALLGLEGDLEIVAQVGAGDEVLWAGQSVEEGCPAGPRQGLVVVQLP